jgi:hypothetical protein
LACVINPRIPDPGTMARPLSSMSFIRHTRKTGLWSSSPPSGCPLRLSTRLLPRRPGQPSPQVGRHLTMAGQTKRPQILQVALPAPLRHRADMIGVPQRPPRVHRPQPPHLQLLLPHPAARPLQPRIRRHRIGLAKSTNPAVPQENMVSQIPRVGPQTPLVNTVL